MDNKMDEKEIQAQKEISHYSNAVNAWFNTNLELDKSFLILSTAAIGFIVSFFKYFNIQSECGLIFDIFSIFSFFICIILTLWTFKKNTLILENHFEGNKEGVDKVRKILQNLYLLISISFILGIIFFLTSAGFFISYSYRHKNQKGVEMSKKVIINENFSNLQKTIPNQNNNNSGNSQSKQNNSNSGSAQTKQDSSNSNSQKK